MEVRPELREIDPYVAGRPIEQVMRERNLPRVAKLASNESPVPPFPEVQAAIAEAAARANRYPEDQSPELRQAIGRRLGLDPDQIWTGAGSGDILLCAALARGGPGSGSVYSEKSFALYPVLARIAGSDPTEVPMGSGLVHDLAAMVDAVDDGTTIVYVCNPNNPTGTVVPLSAIRDLVEGLPESVLIVVDEAYHEYASEEESAVELVSRHANLLVTRTFSKIYGLAGLRVGYGVAQPETIAALSLAQIPFTLNRIAQEAALAALRYPERVDERSTANEAGRTFLTQVLRDWGAEVPDSHTNFVYAELDRDESGVEEHFLGRGVVVKPFPGGALRVTVGAPEENERFAGALREL